MIAVCSTGTNGKGYDEEQQSAANEKCSGKAERHYREWLCRLDSLDDATRRELEEMQDKVSTIDECFGSELTFGTGGMRGVVGAGLNRMNVYIVRRATQGLANYINSLKECLDEKKVAIAYDTRRYSREFALEAALVLAANGIKGLLFEDVRPTPVLSFAIREVKCAAGVVVTASHNPPQYNGYKVYGPDGGQAVSPLADVLTEEIKKVDIFKDVKTMSQPEAEKKGMLELIGAGVDERYREQVRGLSLSRPASKIKVVYTPLHGTGAVVIPPLLRERTFIELSLVEEQMAADPDFTTVKVPNPEEPASFAMALQLARQIGADLVMATDPDGDRVGCAVLSKGEDYVHLTGNQTGALMLEYILKRLKERKELPGRGVMIKTIVTGGLGQKVAASYGVTTEETLTGFKFIGEKMTEYENAGEKTYIFGYEESCGFLAGRYARDKDAVSAAFLIAEMAAFYKEKGKDLLEVLDELSGKHGYFREDLLSIELNDMEESDRLMDLFSNFPQRFEGGEVVEKRDYWRRMAWDFLDGKEYGLSLPRSPVLYYRLSGGSWFCVRPSGTEPKVKIYFSVESDCPRKSEEKLDILKKAVLHILEPLEKTDLK